MKLIHISDLHIGKRVNEMSLAEDQAYILDRICDIAAEQKPDAVMLAGDIYDKSIPSAEAVMMFDDFLTRLSGLCQHIFVISGNHDSPERMAFASRLMDSKGVHLSPVYDGDIRPVTLSDGFGDIDIYMLPYIRPAHVRHLLPENERDSITSYDSAVRKAIEMMDVDPERRNILITHQFVTGCSRSESEDINAGGLDNVDASAFDAFDYVALGHLHRPQDCADGRIRYCGSPMKYSFSEVNDRKSVTIVTLKGKGELIKELIPLTPLREWHDLRGTYEELASRSFYHGTTYGNDFVRITLTDENDIPDAVARLRTIYRNLLELRYDNMRTKAGYAVIGGCAEAESKTPEEMFEELFIRQNGGPMSKEQEKYLHDIISRIREEMEK